MSFNPRRLISGAVLTLALALTACGEAVEQRSLAEGTPNPDAMGAAKQSLVSGYAIRVASGTYTIAGLVAPRWTAPSGHSSSDYITVAQVGSAASSYISWEYVNSTGTSGSGFNVTVPVGSSSAVQYEARYFLANNTLAAVSSAFSVQTTPNIDCGTTISGNVLPTAYTVNLYKTSGNLVVNWNMYGAADGLRVYQGTGTLLYDSGQVYNVGSSGNVAFSNSLGRVLVQAVPDGNNTGNSSWDWVIPCP